MSNTSAERQAAYRQRHLQDEGGGKARLNLLVDFHAKLALARLAKRYGVTQTACLERLIREAQTRELATMDGEEQTAYYDSVTA